MAEPTSSIRNRQIRLIRLSGAGRDNVRDAYPAPPASLRGRWKSAEKVSGRGWHVRGRTAFPQAACRGGTPIAAGPRAACLGALTNGDGSETFGEDLRR